MFLCVGVGPLVALAELLDHSGWWVDFDQIYDLAACCFRVYISVDGLLVAVGEVSSSLVVAY